jgi:hypothetical protein
MPRIALDLNKAEDRQRVGGAPWRRAIGYDPSLPNAGVALETPASSARLPDFDDSGWDVCDDVRQFVSSGFTFGWYRIAVDLPAELDGQSMAGAAVYFETNIDDYGEVWVDGELDYSEGSVAGYNKGQRVLVTRTAEPGKRHVIACIAANGPFGKPNGGIFMRYAYLAFEWRA